MLQGCFDLIHKKGAMYVWVRLDIDLGQEKVTKRWGLDESEVLFVATAFASGVNQECFRCASGMI